ncbi:hypothetical protein [Natronolimnohabitans innermongolicus]|uniref:Uncharacterized protein n=1 Tax=Natronolimnohabitans innermongolicus JCM 12255 TaxID=1227499 RepID=L9WV02_9EURY|nr:hypothetical protein [Natronolimnohabitans innermongolicus]ELY53324.1 hypothetical protein C493_14888 [Natronolimnohabitans innermongolicus JCM 12255]
MIGTVAVAGAVALVIVITVAGAFAWRRVQTRDRRALAAALEDSLADAMGPGVGSHLERAPTVRRIDVVSERGDFAADSRTDDVSIGAADADAQRPSYAPVVRIDLETTDAPGMDLLFEYVTNVLAAIHPVCTARDAPVAYYDVEFTFGPDGLVVAGECRRVSVTPELADRVLEDERYGAVELRRDVERAARDDETPTALWEPCRPTSSGVARGRDRRPE